MLSSNRAYAFGAGGVVLSQAVSALAGVVSLWLLARILTTEQFAGYVVAMSILTLIGYNAGLAIERSMVLRLAALQVVPGVLAGRGMMLRVLIVVLTLSVCAMIGVWLYAQGDADAGPWLAKMLLMIPALTAGLTLVAWFQANHRVGTSAIMQGLTDGARCLLLAGVFLAGFGPVAVAYAAVIAACLPIVVLAYLARGQGETTPNALHWKDFFAGLQFLVMRVSQMGLRQFDIIIVGIFASGLEIAQYAVAARVSAIASVGHIAFSSTYLPRVRRHIANEDWPAIRREFHTARLLGFLLTLCAAIVFFLFGAQALGFFGDFAGGYPALMLLLAAQLLNASFGMQTEHLSMSGDLRLAALTRATSTAVFVVALFVLVPNYGTVGAGFAAMFAAVVLSVTGAVILHMRVGAALMSPRLAVAAVLSGGAMLAGALIPQVWDLSLTVLIGCLSLVVLTERTLLMRLARSLGQT